MEEKSKTPSVAGTTPTPRTHSTPGSSVDEKPCALARDDAMDASKTGSLPRPPARLKDATETDSDALYASTHSGDNSHLDHRTEDEEEEEEDLVEDATGSSQPSEATDLMKYIRQRNALYSRRKYYKRKQELERLEELKHQLEVRNETLRRDNAQLERWMQQAQRQVLAEERNAHSAASASREAILQRLLEDATAPSTSQFSATAAVSLGNHPLALAGVYDDSSRRSQIQRESELQRLLGTTTSTSLRNHQILPQSVRSSGLIPTRSFAAPPPLDVRQMLLTNRMTQPATGLLGLSDNLPLDLPLSHLLSRNSLHSSAASLQQQQLLAHLREERSLNAALLDHARRSETEQLLLRRLLLQQQQSSLPPTLQQLPSSEPSPFLLGALTTTPGATLPDGLLRQLLLQQQQQTKPREEGRSPPAAPPRPPPPR